MADALKAEGNKLFQEKRFAESMCVALASAYLLVDVSDYAQRKVYRSHQH